MTYFSTLFDDQLDTIHHYKNYPEMKPWIGLNYQKSKIKILLVGESHYLDKGSNYHHEPIAWYDGIDISKEIDIGWIKTRNIIQNGIAKNWKEKSKAIYRNIEKAIFDSGLLDSEQETAFSEVAFMNFFQRPAEITGKSIKVSEVDILISSAVFMDVVNIISPDAIIFTSSLAFKYAEEGKVLEILNGKIPYTRTPHPGMPWWNKISKKYGNKTGRIHFIDFIKKQIQ